MHVSMRLCVYVHRYVYTRVPCPSHVPTKLDADVAVATSMRHKNRKLWDPDVVYVQTNLAQARRRRRLLHLRHGVGAPDGRLRSWS